MKSEYLVETYDSVSRDEFFLIVTLRNKKTFFIGLFKKNEKEMIKRKKQYCRLLGYPFNLR